MPVASRKGSSLVALSGGHWRRRLLPALVSSLALLVVFAVAPPVRGATTPSRRVPAEKGSATSGLTTLLSPRLAPTSASPGALGSRLWRPAGVGGLAPVFLPGSGDLAPVRSSLLWHLDRTANATMRSGALTASSCPIAGSCFAVGYATGPGGEEVPLLEHLQAGTWTISSVPVPAAATDVELTGVSCPSRVFCLAVGYYYDDGGDIQVLGERWDGSRWRRAAMVQPSDSAAGLFAISCSSATSCVAVGDYNDIEGTPLPLAESWDGYRWAVAAINPPAGAIASGLFGVSCVAPGTCTAAGSFLTAERTIEPLVESSSTGTWASQAVVVPPDASWSGLEAVSCASTTACMAVGYAISSTGPQRSLAEHFDGSTWTLSAVAEPASSTSSALSAVSCSEADQCAAVGQFSDAAGMHGLAEAWNGTAWARQSLSDPARSTGSALAGVSCPASGSCAAVGGYSQFSTSIGLTSAYLLEDGKWSEVSPVNPPGAETTQLGGVACRSAQRCVAVGFYQDSAGVTEPFAEQSNGSRWRGRPIAAPSRAITSQLTAVACASEKTCFAVGTYSPRAESAVALVERQSGSRWQMKKPRALPKASYSDLTAISCGSARSCTAVGVYSAGSGKMLPLILHWQGDRWTRQRVPLPPGADGGQLEGVSCPSANACEAVGYYNTSTESPQLLLRWNGRTWRTQRSASLRGALAARLSAVSCSSSRYCTAAGFEVDASYRIVGLAERFRAGSWHLQATPQNVAQRVELNSVSCGSRRSCVAVGYGIQSGPTVAVLETWNGSRWSAARPAMPAGSTITFLNGVSCPSAGSCTAVGYRFGVLGIQTSLMIGRG